MSLHRGMDEWWDSADGHRAWLRVSATRSRASYVPAQAMSSSGSLLRWMLTGFLAAWAIPALSFSTWTARLVVLSMVVPEITMPSST